MMSRTKSIYIHYVKLPIFNEELFSLSIPVVFCLNPGTQSNLLVELVFPTLFFLGEKKVFAPNELLLVRTSGMCVAMPFASLLPLRHVAKLRNGNGP